jgi:hypothetical protein
LGPVTTLQNVAVISSMQKTPVVGPWLGAGVGAESTSGAADWGWSVDVARCATAADAANRTNPAKAVTTSAAKSVSLFISTTRFCPIATLSAREDNRQGNREGNRAAPLFVPRVSS